MVATQMDVSPLPAGLVDFNLLAPFVLRTLLSLPPCKLDAPKSSSIYNVYHDSLTSSSSYMLPWQSLLGDLYWYIRCYRSWAV